MRVRDGRSIVGSSSRRLSLLSTILSKRHALVSAVLVSLLVLAVATPAEEGERPAWLRPLADKSDSQPEPGGDIGGRAGWSKLEPGVHDVQAWDWLQMDLDRMLDLTTAPPPNHLSAEAFEAKYLSATVEFLEIDAELGKAFESAVGKSLGELSEARSTILRQRHGAEPERDETVAMSESRENWEKYRKAQGHAARYPLALLRELPRHQLLRETMLRWLLRLNYGMEAAAK